MALMTTLLAGRPVPEAPAADEPSAYIWYGCDLRTGAIVEELPFVPGGTLQRIIGSYTSLNGTVALPDAPPGWKSATDPGRTMLVCVRAEDLYPIWAGIVIGRKGGISSDLQLSLVSLEGYYDRRYVIDRVDTQKNAAQIAIDLVFDAESSEGIGITYQVFVTQGAMDRTYTRDSDQTVYSQLTEIMGVQGGCEWTIEVAWTNSLKTSFTKIFKGGPHVGPIEVVPSAVFDLPGCITDYEYSEDFTSGRGANQVESFGDGEGPSRPQSQPARDEALLAAGWPRYEYRQTFASVTSTAVLGAHSWEALRLKATGAKIFTVSADATTAPKLGVDWVLGSDVIVEIEWSPRHPDGYGTRARAIGWELDTLANVVTPLLQEDAPAYDINFL